MRIVVRAFLVIPRELRALRGVRTGIHAALGGSPEQARDAGHVFARHARRGRPLLDQQFPGDHGGARRCLLSRRADERRRRARKAGLKPLATRIGGGTSNAYADALAALLVADGREVLEWADLIHAMDKLGMNSSVTPMAARVQEKRPFKWVAWDAARLMDMLRGSYLFEDDPKRILQDPESMRASYIRQGSAWQAWAALRDNVLVQINAGEQNPVVLLDAIAERFLGALDAAIHEVLREGRPLEPRPPRLCDFDCKLGSVPPRQRDRSLHHRDCQHGRRDCAANRTLQRPRTDALLHRDLSEGCADGGANCAYRPARPSPISPSWTCGRRFRPTPIR